MDKEELDKRLLDQMLAYVTEQRMEEMAAEYVGGEDVRFTPRLEKRMSRMIGRIRRRELTARAKKAVINARVLIIIHAVMIGAILIHIGLGCFPGSGDSGAAAASSAAVNATQSAQIGELPHDGNPGVFKKPGIDRGGGARPYTIKSADEGGKNVLEFAGAVAKEIEKVLSSLKMTR